MLKAVLLSVVASTSTIFSKIERSHCNLKTYFYEIFLQTLKNQLESESKRLEAENLRRAQEAEEMRLKLEKEKADLAR